MLVDLFMVYQFIKRLATPFDEWKAYELGIIDERGNILKKKRDLATIEERKAFGAFDTMILNLKKLIEKVPGGKTRIASYAAALYLIKEDRDTFGNIDLNKFNKYLELVEESSIFEDAPVNSAGSGAIAGIGVGEDGEPGVKPAKRKKYKKANSGATK